MPSVLAIVSRAVFEKMVPEDVTVGHVVDTDRYVSGKSAFSQLGKGDALFLVTVRPPDEALWLVAVLEKVKRKGDAWVGTQNTTPIRDITGAFKAQPKKLAMSLQTPRVLAEGDVAKLRNGSVSQAVAAYRNEVSATPAARKATKQGRRAAMGTEVLRLVNYRRPFETLAGLAPAQMKQLTRLTRQNGAGKPSALVRHEDWAPMELVDVLDVASGKVTHQLFIWPWGSGELFVADTIKRAGAIIQHGFDLEVEDRAFRIALAAAYSRAEPRLGETVDFQLDRAPAPTADETETKDANDARHAYERLVKALGKSKERFRDFNALTKPQQATIREVIKNAIVVVGRHDLTALGMPPECRLRSWCGHDKPGKLEKRAGKWPVWKWLLETRTRAVTDAEAIAAITKALDPTELPEIALQACEPFFDYGFWGATLLYEGGERTVGPQQVRMVRLLAQLVDGSATGASIGFADRVLREKVEPHVWGQARAAIAAAALALYSQRTSKALTKKHQTLATKAGALYAT